jgi:hypothetical protein
VPSSAQNWPAISHPNVPYPIAHLHHRPHAITPKDMRQSRFGGVQILGQVAVRGVQGGVLNLQDDLLRLRNGIGHIGQAEAADAFEIVDEPGLHVSNDSRRP